MVTLLKIKHFAPHIILGSTLLLFMLFYQFVWIGKERLAGNDSYTHITKAELLLKDGINAASYKNILPFSMWGELDADNTIPFDILITPLVGDNYLIKIKIYIALLFAVLGVYSYTILSTSIEKSYEKFVAISITLLSFIINVGFFLKLTELRSLVLSVLLYLMALHLIFIYKKKEWLLIPIAFVYTLIHTTSFLLIIPIGIFLVVNPEKWKEYFQYTLYIICGIIAAALIFPTNNFLEIIVWHPLIPINYLLADFPIEGAYEVKGDWRTPHNLLITNGLNIICLLTILFIYIKSFYKGGFKGIFKYSVEQRAGLLTFFTFVLLDLFSRRFSDYITIICIVTITLHWDLLRQLFYNLREIFIKKKPLLYAIFLVLLLVTPIVIYTFYVSFIKDNIENVNHDGEKIVSSEAEPFGVGRFISKQYAEDTYIYNSAWEDFPFIFYQGRDLKYAAGMELGFIYFYNKDMLEFYQDFRANRNFEIINGELRYMPFNVDSHNFIKENFKSRVILLKKGKYEPMTNRLIENKEELNLNIVYEDPFYIVVEI